MANVTKAKQLEVMTENKVGMLNEVSSVISDVGVNIKHICAYTMGSEATFMILTSDNQKVIEPLKNKGYKVSESEVVVLGLADKTGAIKEASQKLKDAGINLSYIYGTTCDCSCECGLVFTSDNNDKAIEILS